LRRRFEIALALVALAVGLGLAFALAGGEDDEPPSTTGAPTVTTGKTSPRTETERENERDRRRRRTNVREVERVVSRLVEAVERSDAREACAVLAGAGSTLEECAAAADVDLLALPTSDELSIDRVTVRGRRATATLSGGAVLSLARIGGQWRVTGLRPAATG
jgi:hypothetical protein